jgi:hypothetical protein
MIIARVSSCRTQQAQTKGNDMQSLKQGNSRLGLTTGEVLVDKLLL